MTTPAAIPVDQKVPKSMEVVAEDESYRWCVPKVDKRDTTFEDTVRLAHVVVAPYMRVKDGQVENVSGYEYDREGAIHVPNLVPEQPSIAPTKPAAEAKIARVLQVVDTREWDDNQDPPKPIPGSGDQRSCDRCGRIHEVHVYVRLDNGADACVGSTCARKDEMAMVRRAVSSQGTLDRLRHQLKKAEDNYGAAQVVDAEVAALPLPPIVDSGLAPNQSGKVREWRMGDAWVWSHYGDLGELTDERKAALAEAWQKKRRNERTDLKETWQYLNVIEDLQRRITRAEKSVQKATADQEKEITPTAQIAAATRRRLREMREGPKPDRPPQTPEEIRAYWMDRKARRNKPRSKVVGGIVPSALITAEGGAFGDELVDWKGPQTVTLDDQTMVVIARNQAGQAIEVFNDMAEAMDFVRAHDWTVTGVRKAPTTTFEQDGKTYIKVDQLASEGLSSVKVGRALHEEFVALERDTAYAEGIPAGHNALADAIDAAIKRGANGRGQFTYELTPEALDWLRRSAEPNLRDITRGNAEGGWDAEERATARSLLRQLDRLKRQLGGIEPQAQAVEGRWTRIEDGYRNGDFDITDNGPGIGPAKGSGRWALTYQGRWVGNFDTLAEAKAAAGITPSAQAVEAPPRQDIVVAEGKPWPVPINMGPGPVIEPDQVAEFTKGSKFTQPFYFGGSDAIEQDGYVIFQTSKNVSNHGRGAYMMDSPAYTAAYGPLHQLAVNVQNPLDEFGPEAKALMDTNEFKALREQFKYHFFPRAATNMALQVLAQRRGYDAIYFITGTDPIAKPPGGAQWYKNRKEDGVMVMCVWDARKVAVVRGAGAAMQDAVDIGSVMA